MEWRVEQWSREGTLLYSQQASLRLEVAALSPASQPSSSSSKTGLILGSSLGFLLLLLFLILLLVLLVRGHRRKPDPQSSSTSETSHKPSVWTSGVDNWTCQGREQEIMEISSSRSSSSSSFQTNRSLGDLTSMPGLRPRPSPLALHHPVLSCSRSEGCTSQTSSKGGEGGLGSRPASSLGVSLHPLSLPTQRLSTPTCPGSRASIFHCTQDCFHDRFSEHTTEGSVANDDDIASLSRLVRNGLDLDFSSFSSW